jgi:hypothetical protein
MKVALEAEAIVAEPTIVVPVLTVKVMFAAEAERLIIVTSKQSPVVSPAIAEINEAAVGA